MAELCRYAETCPVCRGLLGLEARLTRRFRSDYCIDEWQACARYAAASEAGGAGVPTDLLPTEHTRAYAIVSNRWLDRGRTPAFTVFGR